MCQTIGRPPTSMSAFGRDAVSAPMRVPSPPARMTAFTTASDGACRDAGSRRGFPSRALPGAVDEYAERFRQRPPPVDDRADKRIGGGFREIPAEGRDLPDLPAVLDRAANQLERQLEIVRELL